MGNQRGTESTPQLPKLNVVGSNPIGHSTTSRVRSMARATSARKCALSVGSACSLSISRAYASFANAVGCSVCAARSDR